MNVVEGRNLTNEMGEPIPVLVYKRLVDIMRWEDGPIGKKIDRLGVVIVGVTDDYTVGSLLTKQTPVVLMGLPEEWGQLYMTIRLREMSPDLNTTLKNRLRELLPDEDIILTTYQDKIHESYRDTERFRGSVTVAAIFMLLITLMGLIGYVSDEIRRRSKEIAIRKVNGATAANVLILLLKNIAWIGIPSAVIGLQGAYVANENPVKSIKLE